MVRKQFSDQVGMRLISQLTKGVPRVPQILVKYLNGTTIPTSFVLPLAGFFLVFLILDLNEFTIAASCNSSM